VDDVLHLLNGYRLRTLSLQVVEKFSHTFLYVTGNLLASFLFTGDDVFKLIGELSGGEMRRMCIARALINCPEFIFADEPTSDLDPQNTAIVMSVLRKAAQNGAGILIVSHDREISSYTDETYTVSEAQLRRVSEE
jgi:ABC-type lipoprotein export system ATPase subunit